MSKVALRGEVERHGGGHPALRHLLAIHLQRDVHRAADLGGQLRFDFHLHLAGRQLVLGLELGALDLEQVELVAQEAVLHVAGDAAGKAGQRVEHAVRIRGHVHLHGHQAVHLAELGRGGFRHAGDGAHRRSIR